MLSRLRGSRRRHVSMMATMATHKSSLVHEGGARRSDLAIETALTLRLIFHLPLRQTEGFVGSVLGLMGVLLDAPDHTTPGSSKKALVHESA